MNQGIIFILICLVLVVFFYPFFVQKEMFTAENQLEDIRDSLNTDIIPVVQIYKDFIQIPSTSTDILTHPDLFKGMAFDWTITKFDSRNFSISFWLYCDDRTTTDENILEVKSTKTYLKIVAKTFPQRRGYLENKRYLSISQSIDSSLFSDPDENNVNIFDTNTKIHCVFTCYTPNSSGQDVLMSMADTKSNSKTHYTLFIDGEKINDYSYGKTIDKIETAQLQVFVGDAKNSQLKDLKLFNHPLFGKTVSELYSRLKPRFENKFNRLRIEMDYLKAMENNETNRMGSAIQIARIVIRDDKGNPVQLHREDVHASDHITGWYGLPDSQYIPIQSDLKDIKQNWPNLFHSHGWFGEFYEVKFNSTPISSVTIYNRTDCCNGRMPSDKLTLYGDNKHAQRTFLTSSYIQSHGFENQEKLHLLDKTIV